MRGCEKECGDSRGEEGYGGGGGGLLIAGGVVFLCTTIETQ